MTLAVSALQAVGLFLVTNIDDIIVLSLFFARGAGAPGTTFKITVGQYLGFGAILVTSILIALGAGLTSYSEAAKQQPNPTPPPASTTLHPQ